MSQSQRVARSIGSNWLALAINIAVSFLLSPFVVNKLGSVYYGIWALIMQFTGYLYLLDFGVRESVVRYTSKYCARNQQRQLSQVLTAAFAIYIPVTIVCIVLALVCAWGIPQWFDLDAQQRTEARWAIVFVGLTIAQTFIFNVFTGVLQGLQRFDIMNAIGIIMSLLRALLIVILLSAGYGVVALAAIQFGVAILAGVIGAVLALRALRNVGMSYRPAALSGRRIRALTRKIFGYGFYVLVNNVAQKINFSSDAIVVAMFLPIRSVTYYAIAGSLVEYLRSLIISTAQVFNPMASRLHALRQGDALGAMLITGGKLNVVLTLPIAITYALLGEEFIGLWMGDEFKGPAGEVLQILALTQIVAAPHYVISSVLYGMSQHRSIALLRVGEAVVNLSLSIFLVQKLGLIGVALGTAISHSALVLFLLPGIVCRRVGLKISAYFLGVYRGPLLAALPFLVGVILLRQYVPAANLLVFFAQVTALTFLYAGCVYWLALDSNEQGMVRGMLQKLRARSAA